MNRLAVVCVLLLVLSALSLVSAQYRARQLFIDLDRAQAEAKKLEIEWNVLQLDQTNYSKNILIDSAARRDLHMQPATPARTQYIALPALQPQRQLPLLPRPELKPQASRAP